jgi:hypothetical protein
MRIAYALVHELMQLSFDKAKRRYDERVKSCLFEVGQRVWYFCPRRRRGLSYKWSMATTGPYSIVKKVNDVNYVIRLTPRHRSFLVNIDRIRPYVDGERPRIGRSPPRNNEVGIDAKTDVGNEPLETSTRSKRNVRPPTRLIEQ